MHRTAAMAATVSGAWNYAVPLDETEDASGTPQTDARDNSSFGIPYERPAKNNSIQKRPSAWDLQSDSEATRARRASMRSAHTSATRKPSRNALRDGGSRRERSQRRDEQFDDSAWIHRDKLAAIEIQEMEEAGIPVRQSRRSMSADPEAFSGRRASRSQSRTGGRREASRDQLNDEDYAAAYPGADDAYSPDQSIAEPPFQRQHVQRPSTSRIPIASPSSTSLGRESPNETRNRSGSGPWTNKWDELQRRKGRSNSASSHVLLDDPEGGRVTPPGMGKKGLSAADGSPPKSRTAKKPSPNGRQTSASARPGSSHGSKANGRSPSVSSRRPGSSGGSKAASATYPEGDPPWLSNMYKPDPRLPPDQQILPTHAKRMMQEQWEKEGKTGTAYDKEFNLLNDEEVQRPKNIAGLSLDSERLDADSTAQNGRQPALPSPTKTSSQPTSPRSPEISLWPMTPKSETGNGRPGTSGGYRITPTVPEPPTMDQLRTQQSAMNVPRIPDLPEKDEAKPKKACCCVMM